MKKKIILSSLLFLAPVLSFAAGPTFAATADTCKQANPLKSIAGFFNFFTCTIVSSIIPLLFTIATAAFIWGIIQYFLNPENEEKRSQGKSYMLWGIIALFVMVSMWGLVGVIGNTFGVKTLLPQLSQ